MPSFKWDNSAIQKTFTHVDNTIENALIKESVLEQESSIVIQDVCLPEKIWTKININQERFNTLGNIVGFLYLNFVVKHIRGKKTRLLKT